MAGPLGGPGFGFSWLDGSSGGNTGFVLPGTTTNVATLTSASATIGLTGSLSVNKGQLVSAPSGLPSPDFVSANFTNSGSITVSGTATSTGTQTISISPLPIAIGGEWSSTLAAGGTLESSYWRNTGVVLPQTDYKGAMFGDVYLQIGGSVTPAAGQTVNLWFEKSYDGGSTFEAGFVTSGTTTPPFSRAPDAIIPLPAAALVAGNKLSAGAPVQLPAEPHKILIWNAGTVALPAGGMILIGPEAPEY